jgi:hypothetical protein
MHFLATNGVDGIRSTKGIYGEAGVSGTGHGDVSLILLVGKSGGQSSCPKIAIPIYLLVPQSGTSSTKSNVVREWRVGFMAPYPAGRPRQYMVYSLLRDVVNCGRSRVVGEAEVVCFLC